ncbi:MAG TPA: sulfotransferase [Pirellulales bacterium]|nr:sulfotransferase [Pirellulales bacterium]
MAELNALIAQAEGHHRAGRLVEAVATYRQILTERPEIAEVHNSLGLVLKAQGKLDEAAAQYARAIALKPTLFQAHNNLGNVLRLQNRLAEAAESYQRAVALGPDQPDTHTNLGKVLAHLGRLDEAAACFDRALTLRPTDAEAHYHRFDLKTYRRGDADLAMLETLGANAHRLSTQDRIFVHFALGKALEDIGEYERAFEQWIQGNGLIRRETAYDEAATERGMKMLAQVFDAELLARLAGVGDPSPAPIFILGMPRSGSTLVEQILASHPAVHAAGELDNLDRIVKQSLESAEQTFPTWTEWLDGERLRELGAAYLASLPPRPAGKARVTDKAPSNFLYVGLIRLMLPGAKIVHTVRNPIDTCISCFSRRFINGQKFSYELGELGRFCRMYRGLMDHWRAVLPEGAMLDVEYEAVVDDLPGQARRLIEYCGLPWDDRCLAFHKTDRPVTTASKAQVRRPLYGSSVERWRRYEKFLQPLLEGLGLES